MVLLVVLVSLLAATALAVWRPAVSAVVAVAAAGVAWWLVSAPVEGPVLVEVTPTHGLAAADLLVPPLVLVAVLALLRERRRAGRGERVGPDAAGDRERGAPPSRTAGGSSGRGRD